MCVCVCVCVCVCECVCVSVCVCVCVDVHICVWQNVPQDTGSSASASDWWNSSPCVESRVAQWCGVTSVAFFAASWTCFALTKFWHMEYVSLRVLASGACSGVSRCLFGFGVC